MYQWPRSTLTLHTPSIVNDFSAHYTDLFEIIHEDDPHIVDEDSPRAIHLGYRCKATGEYHPIQYQLGTIQSLINLQKTDRGEGFMAWMSTDLDYLSPAKFKTDYYVGKKKLMRMTNNNTSVMFSNPQKTLDKLPSMWHDAVFKIQNRCTISEWQALSDQERRAFLESLE
jgi:hypothetical protein